MRSVVVVLPASTWAMMPIFRTFSSMVVATRQHFCPRFSYETTQYRTGKPNPSLPASAVNGAQSPVFPRLVAGRRSGGPQRQIAGASDRRHPCQFIAEQSNPTTVMLESHVVQSSPTSPTSFNLRNLDA